MKPSEFYTQNLYTEPNTGNILTDNLKNYNVDKFTSAYWLGWISWDNIPKYTHLSTYSVTAQTVTFYDVTKKQNSNIGYTANGSYNLGGSQYGDIAKKEENAHITTINYMRFANKLDIMSIGSRPLLSLRFNASTESSTDGGETWIKYGVRQISAINVNGFDFLFKDSSVTIQVQPGYGGTLETFNLKLSEIGEDNVWWFERTGEYQGTTYLNRFGVSIYDFFVTAPLRDINSDGQLAQYIGASPFIDLETENYRGFTSFTGVTSTYGSAEMRLTAGSGTPQITGLYNPNLLSNFGLVPGGYNFSVPVSWTAQSNYPNALYSGNALLWHRSSYIQVYRVLSKDEIQKTFCLQPYIWVNENVTRTYGYTENCSYVSYITDENEFTATIITGNLTDDEFRDKLRLWQYDVTEWEENEYTEDDKPEYEPEPGDEGENGGDKITRPASIGIGGTNGFVTQYALNASDIAQLGSLLWTSFIDQDYWKNYMFSLALDTGSFSLAGLLNFFVSCKVYPFSLVNVDSFSSWGSDMYVGTGIVPLHFNSPIHVINNYCSYISGGWIEIPRHFNDYRDYINTEITLYLPFCGTVHLNPGDVIGNRLDIQYAIDFATGGCIAYVDLTTGDGAGYPIAAMPGQVGADIPLTATAAGEVAARFIGDAMNVGELISGEVGGIAKGAASALSGGSVSGSGSGGSVFAGVAGMYGGIGAAMAVDLAPKLAKQGLQMLSRGAVQAPILSGGRGFASFGAPSRPYVQIRRGIYPTVTGLGDIAGYPAAGTYTIGSLSGFVQGDAKIEGLNCPDSDKAKIKNLIASGIYV